MTSVKKDSFSTSIIMLETDPLCPIDVFNFTDKEFRDSVSIELLRICCDSYKCASKTSCF